MSSPNEIEHGATVVITHHVQDGQQANYEAWLQEILPVSKASPGHLDLQIIRPIAGLTTTYTIVIRFDTHAHLQQWVTSPQRKVLIEKVRPVLKKDDNFQVNCGLEFLFTPQGGKNNSPKRWKQALLTWSALFPVGLVTNLVMSPILNQIAIFDNRYLRTLVFSGVAVLIMVYLVMPRYTKLVHKWLFS